MKPTLILRHRRENLKKCSLRGLEGRPGLIFYSYPEDSLPNLSNYLLLKVGAPPLSLSDGQKGLLLIDATWRLAQVMERQISASIETRSLPDKFLTAYPRRQTNCPDPEAGLASIEALYLAHLLMGDPEAETLLDLYRWKELFFKFNSARLLKERQEKPLALQ